MLNAIIGFSGGGGVESGTIQAGVDPVLSIEFDPGKPQLSNAIADTFEQNFKTPLLRMTVQDWAANSFKGCPDRVDLAHFSPVCCNFSQLTNKGDMRNDISSAMAIVDFIKAKQPYCLTLENVPAYQNSHSWELIMRSLLDNGYMPNAQIVNFADYGVPQNRKRFFCVALKNAWFPNLQKQNHVGWGTVLDGLKLEETALTEAQQKAITNINKKDLPVLIPRVGYRNGIPRITSHWKPAPTVVRSLFDDGKGSGRNQVWTIWNGRNAYNCNIEFFRRIQTFPDCYQFSGDIRIDGSIIGNSVPPLFIKKVYQAINKTLVLSINK